MLKNIRRLGYESDLDEDALAVVSAHFREIAEREGLPIGRPMEYDLFHFEHQVPGGMVTNLTRQLREIGMEHRLDEILEEVIEVRREFGYPVMATPYSQIVGAQAFENVVSGERYGTVTDETIKYVLEYYGKPAFPIDQGVMDRVMSLPRTQEFLDWRPERYLKSVDELRQEIGPDLSDDDLLLKILIPGGGAKRRGPTGPASAAPEGAPAARAAAPATRGAPAGASPDLTHFPRQFSVDVDGEVFNVKVSPVWDEGEGAAGVVKEPRAPSGPRELPEGAVVCGAAGLVLSIQLKVGDSVADGDEVATIESMKMRRCIVSSKQGVVQEIRAQEGQMVQAEDVLIVLA